MKGEKAMLKTIASILLIAGIAVPAIAQELTWRKDIAPIVLMKCGMCHGQNAPEYNDWMLLGDEKRKTVGSRMDSYPHFMSYVLWPATGAMMRRLDDGKAAGGKPGNMYMFLGGTDAERTASLKTIKDWLGDGAWNLNRWKARGDVPGITKEQLDKINAKY
jgi:hypothetical protein